MTNNPCPSCVETIADTLKAFDAMWTDGTPPRADVRRLIERLGPKSPAQALAEECPHTDKVDVIAWMMERENNTPADEASQDYLTHNLPPVPADARMEMKLHHTPDTAPRYVFGPWVVMKTGENPFPVDAEYQVYPSMNIWLNNKKPFVESRNRRAYRIGQTYPHDGGECPLADGSVMVDANYRDRRHTLACPAMYISWSIVTSFTPIDEGKGS